MTSKSKAAAQGIQTILEALVDSASKPYFDHVWIGVPSKIPMGDKSIAMIEVISNPNFYYTTCPAQTQFDVDFMVNIVCKGQIEEATLRTIELVEIVQTALIMDQKIQSTCIGSTVEEVQYMDMVQDNKALATGARIRLRCRI